jgi:hypothetical protein
MTDYTTTAALKSYLRITSTADDALIASLITRASIMIDNHCGRWFSAKTMTRSYDAVGYHITGRLLLLDADLLTVTTIINGDGMNISPMAVLLRPINWPPYFGISLTQSSGLHWTYLDDPEGAISISGTWGYDAVTPEPVVQAAIRLASWLYRQRDTGAEPVAEPQPDARGVIRPPAHLPVDITQMLMPYIRTRIKAVA